MINLEELVAQSLKKIENYLKENDFENAEALVLQLLKVKNDCFEAYQLYGVILYAQKKYEESVEIISKAIDLNPNNSENFNNLSLSYLRLSKLNEALESQLKCVSLNPNNFNYLNNLALVYRMCNNVDKAIECFEKSIKINSNNSKTYEGLGCLYGQSKQMDKAIECFEKSCEIEPKNLSAYFEMAYAYFLKGDFEKGWQHYEYRLECWHKLRLPSGIYYELFPKEKNWDGKQSLKNKKIIVFCEQGIGDYINFIRFVPKLKDLGAIVYLEAQENLIDLFKDFGTVVSDRNNEIYSNYDYHCSVISLPYLLKLPIEQYKCKSYLKTEDKFDMSQYKDNFKIGISWAGNPSHPTDSLRSCYLSNFREISKIENVKLFSLQKDKRKRKYNDSEEIIDFSEGCDDMKIVDMSPYMNNFLDTAKIIQSLDLVITVDTSILHLAGALGKETWALIAYYCDWRWMSFGDDNIWYESVKLFRQEKSQSWKEPFNKIKEKLLTIVQKS